MTHFFRLFPVVVATAFVVGCFGAGHSSNWIVLDSAKGVDCERWPQRLEDLKLLDMAVMEGKQRDLYVTALQRDGSPIYYLSRFDGSDFDKDEISVLQLGSGGVLLGGGTFSADNQIVIVRNFEKESKLEIRDRVTNVVSHTAVFDSKPITEGKVFFQGNRVWILYRQPESGIKVAYFDKSKDLKIYKLGKLEFELYPVILPGKEEGQSLLMWATGTTGKVFRMRIIDKAGKVSKPLHLDVDIDSQVESWTAIPKGGSYMLAYIDGDSLVGQAKLRLTGFGINLGTAAVESKQEIALKDVHVTDPTVVATPEGLEVMVFMWTDEESTLAHYKVTGGTVSSPSYHGVFPKGSRIMDQFREGNDQFFVVRSRMGIGWTFDLCEI